MASGDDSIPQIEPLHVKLVACGRHDLRSFRETSSFYGVFFARALTRSTDPAYDKAIDVNLAIPESLVPLT